MTPLVDLNSESLESAIIEDVETLPTSRTAKAYVAGLFLDQARGQRIVDFSKDSIVLAHIEVRKLADIDKAQQIGDWALWVSTWFPGHVAASVSLVETFGRLSYHRCYRLVPSWRVYEELADSLPDIIRHLKRRALSAP